MALATPAPQKKPWAFEDILAPPSTTNRPATFAPPADTTTNRAAPPMARPMAPIRPYVRPAGTIRLDDVIGQRADAYRAQAGTNPRLGGRQEGESIGAFNQRIARWDAGFNRATGRKFNRATGEWDNSSATQMFDYGQRRWINPTTGEPTAGPGGTDPATGAGGAGSAGSAGGGQPGAGGGAEVLATMLPYDDATIQRLSGEAASKRASDLEQAQEEMFLAGARGGSFQPAAQAQAAATTQAARSGLSGDIGGIKNEAIKANYAATQQQLDRQLEEKRLAFQDRWQATQDETQRRQIENEWNIAQAQIQAQKDMAERSAAAAGAAAGRGRAWDLEDRQAQWEREDEMYYRNLPFLMSQYTDFGD